MVDLRGPCSVNDDSPRQVVLGILHLSLVSSSEVQRPLVHTSTYIDSSSLVHTSTYIDMLSTIGMQFFASSPPIQLHRLLAIQHPRAAASVLKASRPWAAS